LIKFASLISYTTICLTTFKRETTANFTYSPKNPTTADNISFNASSSYDPDGNIASYEWDFGDGNTSSGEIVTYRYTTAGTYIVNLTVTDDDGATGWITKNVAVIVTVITTCEELQNIHRR